MGIFGIYFCCCRWCRASREGYDLEGRIILILDLYPIVGNPSLKSRSIDESIWLWRDWGSLTPLFRTERIGLEILVIDMAITRRQIWRDLENNGTITAELLYVIWISLTPPAPDDVVPRKRTTLKPCLLCCKMEGKMLDGMPVYTVFRRNHEEPEFDRIVGQPPWKNGVDPIRPFPEEKNQRSGKTMCRIVIQTGDGFFSGTKCHAARHP